MRITTTSISYNQKYPIIVENMIYKKSNASEYSLHIGIRLLSLFKIEWNRFSKNRKDQLTEFAWNFDQN